MAKKIFINYRREDTQQDADALYDFLEKKVGRKQVFMDIDTISPGENFIEVVKERLQDADVILMLIGPEWEENVRSRAKAGKPDYVLQEIDWALASGKTIIPVLFYRNNIPDYESLKDVPYGSRLPDLAPINAVRITRDYRKVGYQRIVKAAGLSASMPSPPKNRVLPVIFIVLALLVVLWWQPWQNSVFTGGNEKAEQAWQKAQQSGKFADYKEYVKNYPDGNHVSKAEENIQQIRKRLYIPKMVKIEGGTFRMGSNVSEADEDEQPQHEVTVSDFYIGKYEVTHKQYIAFMNDLGVKEDGSYNGTEYVDMDTSDCAVGYRNGKFYFKGSDYADSEQCPMLEVTWYGTDAYCEWLSKKTGQTYRLPTEAEWEYAAGGGAENRTKYAGTDNKNELEEYAWYGVNYYDLDSKHDDFAKNPVGKKKPNALGLYDMSGNVWEWCRDWYDENYYSNSSQNDPKGPVDGSKHVNHGGSWDGDAEDCRVANRNGSTPGSSNGFLGFRLARIP